MAPSPLIVVLGASAGGVQSLRDVVGGLPPDFDGAVSGSGVVAGVAGLSGIPVWGWVVIFIVANTLMNIFGIKTTKLLNWLFLAAELVVLVIFLIFGLAVDAVKIARLAGRVLSETERFLEWEKQRARTVVV